MFLKFDNDAEATIECNDVEWCNRAMQGLIGNYDGTVICAADSYSSCIDEINERVRELEEKLENLLKDEREQGIRAQLEALRL